VELKAIAFDILDTAGRDPARLDRGGVDTRPDPSFDFNATSFADFAAQLDPRLWPSRDNRAPAR
jgi:hypothetical protein